MRRKTILPKQQPASARSQTLEKTEAYQLKSIIQMGSMIETNFFRSSTSGSNTSPNHTHFKNTHFG